MTTLNKMVMCLGLVAVLGLPACSGTWQGIKNDWGDVTSSNDAAPMEQQQEEMQAAKAESYEGPSAYN